MLTFQKCTYNPIYWPKKDLWAPRELLDSLLIVSS